MRAGFAQMGRRLDLVEATLSRIDGRLTSLSRGGIWTDRRAAELCARQHVQQQSIDDLYAHIERLEQSSQQ